MDRIMAIAVTATPATIRIAKPMHTILTTSVLFICASIYLQL